MGAALVAWHHVLGNGREPSQPDGMSGAFLGPGPDLAEVRAALDAWGLAAREIDDPGTMAREVARLLAGGQVVGVVQGRMEFGPRALGSRSILADPRLPDMQRRVNLKVKFREGFRPFAPAVLAGKASEWFDLDAESPYMLVVAPVAEAKRIGVSPGDSRREGLAKLDVVRSQVPAVTHVDLSARVQTVRPDTNPWFHSVIREFEGATGCPVVLNTSFNLRGEPICCSPHDACRTFVKSGMDALSIGPFLVGRPAGPVAEPPRPAPIDPDAPARARLELRKFGLTVGSALVVFGLLCLWNGWTLPGAALGAAGIALALAALAAPARLRGVERGWKAFSRVLLRVNTAVLLSAVYVVIVTPIALLRRPFARDPLGMRVDRGRGSYWEDPASPEVPDRDGYRRLY